MNIPPKKLIVMTIVGAIVTIIFERLGIYDRIMKMV